MNVQQTSLAIVASIPLSSGAGAVLRRCIVSLVVLAVLFGCLAGCNKDGSLKTSSELFSGEEETTEEQAAQKPSPAARSTREKENTGTTGRRTPLKKIVEIKRTPDDVLAELEASKWKVRSDSELQALVAVLGEKTDLVPKLNLAAGRVGDLSPLEHFSNLKELNLKSLRQGNEGWAPLATLKNLELLNLTNTNFRDDDLDYISGLVLLKTLILAGTKVTDAGFVHLSKFRDIEHLDVSQTRHITGSGFVAIRKKGKALSRLRKLVAHNSQFGKLGAGALAGMKTLEYVDLGDSFLGLNGVMGLKGCSNVTWLNIGFNTFPAQGMLALKGLRKLESLNLRNAQFVNDAGLAQLKRAKNLEFLNADGTRITIKALMALKKKIPKLKYQYRGKEYK